jgi:chromate transporter
MTSSLREFTGVVLRDVNRTIGGGMAAMELMRRSFEARGWVDASLHGLFVAVSRLTPGTNVLAYCAAVGWRLHGWRGTLAAIAAASIPGSLIIFVLTATVVRLDRYPVVRAALSLGMLVAAVLVLSSAWNLLKPYLRPGRWPRALFVSGAAISLYLVGLTPVRVLLISALVGALLPSPSNTTADRGDRPAGPSLRLPPARRRGGSSDPPSPPVEPA